MKRSQLIQLTKHFHLKSNGKNVDIIQRLIDHNNTLSLPPLPSTSTTSAHTTSDELDNVAVHQEDAPTRSNEAEEDISQVASVQIVSSDRRSTAEPIDSPMQLLAGGGTTMDETGMDSNSDISMNLNNVEDIDELPRSMIHISPITSRPIPKGTTSIARLASSNDSSFNDDDLPLAPCTEEPPTLFQFGSTTSSDFTFASLPLLFPASTATRSDEAQGLSASQQMVLEMTRRMVEFRPPVTANGGSKWTSGDASASASSRIGKRKAGEDKSDKSGFDRIHERQFMNSDSISNHYAAKRSASSTSLHLPHSTGTSSLSHARFLSTPNLAALAYPGGEEVGRSAKRMKSSLSTSASTPVINSFLSSTVPVGQVASRPVSLVSARAGSRKSVQKRVSTSTRVKRSESDMEGDKQSRNVAEVTVNEGQRVASFPERIIKGIKLKSTLQRGTTSLAIASGSGTIVSTGIQKKVLSVSSSLAAGLSSTKSLSSSFGTGSRFAPSTSLAGSHSKAETEKGKGTVLKKGPNRNQYDAKASLQNAMNKGHVAKTSVRTSVFAPTSLGTAAAPSQSLASSLGSSFSRSIRPTLSLAKDASTGQSRDVLETISNSLKVAKGSKGVSEGMVKPLLGLQQSGITSGKKLLSIGSKKLTRGMK